MSKGNILLVVLVAVAFLVTGIGAYFLGAQGGFGQKPSTNLPLSEPSPSPEQELKQGAQQKATVYTPSEYGFTKTMELKAIGVKAKFPEHAKSSLFQEKFYVIKSGQDEATFSLKNYDGTGRRAWFQNNYPYAKNYVLEPFTGQGHNGYIAYAKLEKDLPGGFFYFSAINSTAMLVVNGSDYVDHQSVFFSHDLQRVKNFISTIELTALQNTKLSDLTISDLYRWADIRKTIWEDSSLGLKITAPEWVEMRYTKERDENGKYTFTDWSRAYPEAKIYENSDSKVTGYIKSISVTGAYTSSPNLNILSAAFIGKTFSDVVNEKLIPGGFCAQEWKNSKSECTDIHYCYTKEEVLNNLILKKQIKIGVLDAQLRSMNENFSSTNDCRSEDTWLIKSSNGQYVVSSILPEGGTFRLEKL